MAAPRKYSDELRERATRMAIELRADPALRRTVVFVMTTSAAAEDRMRAYDRNVAGYILKHPPGEAFRESIAMLRHYWRVITFPD